MTPGPADWSPITTRNAGDSCAASPASVTASSATRPTVGIRTSTSACGSGAVVAHAPDQRRDRASVTVTGSPGFPAADPVDEGRRRVGGDVVHHADLPAVRLDGRRLGEHLGGVVAALDVDVGLELLEQG